MALGRGPQHLKQELLAEVARLVRERCPRERADTIERFVAGFYANVPPEDIAQATPERLYGAALAILGLAEQRASGEALVRVYGPTIDRHGWQSAHTAVEVVTDDMPFLVDSVTAALDRLGLAVHLIIHPVMRVRRDARGVLLELFEPETAPAEAVAESVIHVTIDRLSDAERLEQVRAELVRVLADVRAAVEDWSMVRDRVKEAAAELRTLAGTAPALAEEARKALTEEADEAAEFLVWADDDHFIFLGYRVYRFAEDGNDDGQPSEAGVVPGSGLGLLRDDGLSVFGGLRNLGDLPPEVQFFVRQPQPLRVTKANRVATVHRPAQLDAVFVKTFDDRGRVTGERLFVGLFTSIAYNRLVRDIPFLRRKVSRALARAGFESRSHDGRVLLHVLGTLPRDELFQIREEELYDLGLGVLHLQERQRIALFVRRDPFERFVSCLVYVPRDRYDTPFRKAAQTVLEQSFGGLCSAYYTQVADSKLARIHFIITTAAKLGTQPGTQPGTQFGASVYSDLHDIEARLVEAARSWPDRLREALIEARGEEQGLRLMRRYGEAFPLGYRERVGAEAAVFDIGQIEQALATDRLGMNLYRPLEAAGHELRFRVYHCGAPLPLTDVLPMLEHLDLRVITELPYEVHPDDLAQSVWIHDFVAETRTRAAIDPAAIKDKFQEAFDQVWNRRMEDDGFNRLILRAGLDWREVTLLRAQARYLRQACFPFSLETIAETLAAHPHIAARILRLFLTLHDPAWPRLRQGLADPEIDGQFDALVRALDVVTNLDEDRILRRLINVTMATLRTNYFQRGGDGSPKPYLSFKLDSLALDDLPLPRPLVEVFVYSPRMEGIHLRGGKVARGGIRWSDRREDFRTEILGLMKAQMVKNIVIVPVGSKGGFVVKRPPPESAGREAFQAEGIECYKILIRGLLDVTDSLAPDGSVLPPADVLRLDDDDPYLVVAADKGTATFSDIANGVSREYRFWLDDAFASGGSAGYDHKRMGITARGAWESVKRHFRELCHDCQNADFICVGVGDMAGDVFGNAMLLSRHIKLVGAFNHRHIFCDPNPDPELSFAERERLFHLPRLAWSDYDPARLSPGGAVFDRQSKSLHLTPEIRACFGISAELITPSDLIKAMLRAEVDLLWFGGIGTFIKARRESHADVGDKASDALRIDADQVRAKIIGEGANLGMTQPARIEAALRGVRLNTDAIDNSAGVDTSDHEVNIKVLLGDVVGRGDMTLKQRNEILASMTAEVAGLVLRDNYLQTQALSVLQAAGPEALERHARFMRRLEKAGRLNRAVERLPDDDDLRQRGQDRQGLTRPELAVLLAYAKITLYEDLLAAKLPDDARMQDELFGYFPQVLRERFPEAIPRHRLRREIVATRLTNDLINRAGPTFIIDMIDKSGHPPCDVARSYVVVRDAFELPALWVAIEALDNQISATVQTAMLRETIALLERGVVWFLANGCHPMDIGAEIATYRPAVAALTAMLGECLGSERRAAMERLRGWLIDQGAPEALAQAVAALPVLAAATDIARIARAVGRDTPAVAAVYFALGDRFALDWLREQAQTTKTDNDWQKQAATAIVDDLLGHQSRLATSVLETTAADQNPVEAIEAWCLNRRAGMERIGVLLTELRAQSTLDLAMLAVANRHLRTLITG
ncbi:NAD-specific glutamate dehydrogenase [uncultured Gammaproteobacteria bacterium]